MQIQIRRYRINATATDGTLSINGVRICDTAESTQHMLPPGTYRIALRYHRASHRRVPVLETGIKATGVGMIGIGNGVYHLRDARILVGTYLAPGCLVRSRSPFMLLYDRINATLRRGHDVTLRIAE